MNVSKVFWEFGWVFKGLLGFHAEFQRFLEDIQRLIENSKESKMIFENCLKNPTSDTSHQGVFEVYNEDFLTISEFNSKNLEISMNFWKLINIFRSLFTKSEDYRKIYRDCLRIYEYWLMNLKNPWRFFEEYEEKFENLLGLWTYPEKLHSFEQVSEEKMKTL